mmetsp:Transcript_28975/g.46779  ORF Transcript_28975/g.46779 Transcript_28975/m.46779 type:complete len:440 (+) Transcript_28975:52-1371(+)
MASSSQTILDEETYTKAMEGIINKHFFPELEKMKAQVAVMEAVDANSAEKMEEARELIMEAADPQSKFAVGDKVVNTSGMSLDAFLKDYTNEDNVSFTELFKKHREEHRKKNQWLFDRDACFKAEVLRIGGEKALLDFEREQEAKRVELAERKKLMLPPPPKSKLEMDQRRIKEQMKKPKEINYAGTQFAGQHNTGKDLTSFVSKPQESVLFSGISNELELMAQRKLMAEQGNYNLDDLMLTPHGPAPSPRVNGYGFAATPQFSPGGSEGMSPLITWGTVSTPLTLAVDPEEYLQGPKFNIAERSKRDEKAKRLADEASKRMRLEKAAKQPKRPGSLASPISTPRSSKSLTPSPSTRLLTPAAQELARKLGKVRPSSDLFGASKRARTDASTPSSTPSQRRASSVSTSAPSPMLRTTGRASSATPSDRGSSITDGLLKI